MTKIYRPEQPVAVSVMHRTLIVRLANGHVIFAPLADFRSLADAMPEQLANYEANPASIYWPDLDDGIDVDWLLDHVGYKADDLLVFPVRKPTRTKVGIKAGVEKRAPIVIWDEDDE